MATTRVGDIDFEYYVEGDGPPLLMIMGMAGQASSRGQPFLKALQQHFTTIRFSNRGTGRSGQSSELTTVRVMADDTAGLLKALDTPNTHVIGISMGGMIAQELVLNYPEAVQGLVLGCTSSGASHGIPVPPATLARLGAMTSLPMQERTKAFWSVTVTPEFERDHDDFLNGIVAAGMESPTPVETMARQMGAIMSFDTYERLPRVKAPTLILHGDRDALVPVGNAEILHGRIPGSEMRIVTGTGHCFFWEKPEESAGAVVEFLARVPTPA